MGQQIGTLYCPPPPCCQQLLSHAYTFPRQEMGPRASPEQQGLNDDRGGPGRKTLGHGDYDGQAAGIQKPGTHTEMGSAPIRSQTATHSPTVLVTPSHAPLLPHHFCSQKVHPEHVGDTVPSNPLQLRVPTPSSWGKPGASPPCVTRPFAHTAFQPSLPSTGPGKGFSLECTE